MYEESPVKGGSQTVVKRSSNYSDRRDFSISGPHISSSYEKNSYLKKSVSGHIVELPDLPADLVREVERNYFKRRGPVVSTRRVGKSFVFGTREFIVARQSGQIVAKDVPQDSERVPGALPEQSTFIPIEQYFNKFEQEERSKCKAVNLSLLNDDNNDDENDDEFGEVGEEFDKDN